MAARDYVRLARLQTSGVTAVAPVLGYLAAGYGSGRLGGDPWVGPLPMTFETFTLLVGLGLAAHIFGFVHNEIADRGVDAKAAYRRPKPLPSGAVSLGGAWALALLALIAGFAISGLLSQRQDSSVLVLAGISVAFAAVYNVAGKKVVGGDAFLAASIFAFVLCGAGAESGFAGMLALAPIAVAAVGALIVFFNNAFEGGFKDHASDKEGGKRTLVLALRVRGEKYDSPDGLMLFAQIPVHAAMLLVTLYLVLGPLSLADSFMNLVRVALAFALTVAMARFYNRALAMVERPKMLAFFARHEGAALLLLMLPFLGHISLAWFAGLFIGPLLVFLAVNKALFGTLAAPDV